MQEVIKDVQGASAIHGKGSVYSKVTIPPLEICLPLGGPNLFCRGHGGTKIKSAKPYPHLLPHLVKENCNSGGGKIQNCNLTHLYGLSVVADDAALDLEEVDALAPALLDARRRVVVLARGHSRRPRSRSRERERRRRRRRAVLRMNEKDIYYSRYKIVCLQWDKVKKVIITITGLPG